MHLGVHCSECKNFTLRAKNVLKVACTSVTIFEKIMMQYRIFAVQIHVIYYQNDLIHK